MFLLAWHAAEPVRVNVRWRSSAPLLNEHAHACITYLIRKQFYYLFSFTEAQKSIDESQLDNEECVG